MTKKLKLSTFDEESIKSLISKQDITIQENYLFNKEIPPLNLKSVNYQSFAYATRDKTRFKCLLIKNKEEKLNRDVLNKIQVLAELNPEVDFLHVFNTEANLSFLKEKLNIPDQTPFPQLIILPIDQDQNLVYFPSETLLKFSSKTEEIHQKLNKIFSKFSCKI